MKYELYINNEVVAIVITKNKDQAIREILHYFSLYLTEDFNEIKVVRLIYEI